MKSIGVVTTSRADFGLLYPIIDKLNMSNYFSVRVIATGMHLLKEYGYTLQYVREKCENVDEVDIFMNDINTYTLIKSIGIGFMSFSDYLKNNKFDAILVLGDRTELIVPVYSSMICNIPIVHIFGGDSIADYVTYDNNIRHCITKLSNIHFTATKEHEDRIKKMGEEEWRIFNVGSPAIDYIKNCNYIDKEILYKKFKKINFDNPFCVLTFHPIPTDIKNIKNQINNIIETLNENNIQVICTKSNNDIGSEIILERIKQENNDNDKFMLVEQLSQEEYYSFLKYCSFMIGNSSSIILESSSFNIPGINVGTRQLGRIKGDNVIDTSYSKDEINQAINKCLFNNNLKTICKNCTNPYGDGNSAERIINILSSILDDKQKLLIKKNTY